MKTSQNKITIEQHTLTSPIHIIGKDFFGSYQNTSEYLDQIKKELKTLNISFKELEAVSIYLSDPSTEQQGKLKSFHGFVTESYTSKEGLTAKKLSKRKYVITKTKDPSHIWDMFGEAYKYAGQNNLLISDQPPTLITTVEKNAPLFTMYFNID